MEEIRKRLSHIVRGSKSKLKDDDVISFTFITDSGSISYGVEEVPDLMQVLKDLFEPDSLKLEVYKNSQLIRSYQLIDKPKPVISQNQNFIPQAQPQTNFNFDLREFMSSMERMVSGITTNQEKLVKEVFTEMKSQQSEFIGLTEKQKKETEKFYEELLQDQRKFSKDVVESERETFKIRINQENEFWKRELDRKEEHFKTILDYEKQKVLLTKDSSSGTVNALKDYAGLVKDGLTGALEVIEEHGDKIERVVNLYQSAKATTVNPMDIPAEG